MSTAAELACDGRSVTVQMPLAFRKRGGRKQVVAPEGWSGPVPAPRPARVDGTLVKALARAHRWQGMLNSDGFGSIEELAAAERINSSYMARVLRLTLLAPNITDSILGGQHDPETINLERLMLPCPAVWGEQPQSLWSAASCQLQTLAWSRKAHGQGSTDPRDYPPEPTGECPGKAKCAAGGRSTRSDFETCLRGSLLRE
jgi:hypothetical protein